MENNQQLPKEDLKEFGLMNDDNSFSKRLSKEDIDKFLQGYIIIADHEKDRITFQLTDNNSRLKVQQFQRDKALDKILEDSQSEIQYSELKAFSQNEKDKDYGVKVFVANKDKSEVKEYDLFQDMKELTLIILATKELKEIDKYKTELLKLKGFIQDKIDKFPELGKQLTENLNIVSNEINTVNSTSIELNKNQEKSKVDLDVNDPDLYQDASREREEEQKIEQEVRRGRRR